MTLGIGLPWQHEEKNSTYIISMLQVLQPPFWINWKYDHLGEAGYLPMVWAVKMDKHMTEAMGFAPQYPNQLWLLGNEPERKDQSDTEPAEFAAVAAVWQERIGGLWAAPGVIIHDIDRRGYDWIDSYLRVGGPVPPVWQIHIYGQLLYPDWLKRVEEFRRWLSERKADRPVMVTETNASGHTLDDQKRLMDGLVDSSIASLWYSARDPFQVWPWTDLHTENLTLTPLGAHYLQTRQEKHVYVPSVHA